MLRVINAMKTKILVVTSTFTSNESGAHSARATVKYLKILNYSVGVYAGDVGSNQYDTKEVAINQFKIPSKKSWHNFLYSPILKADFKSILNSFSPDYVLFVGGADSYKSLLSRIVRKQNIKTAFLFYINDFFCHLTYAGRSNGPCDACIRQPIIAPNYFGCVDLQQIPSLIYGVLRRYALAREIRKADAVLNYGFTQAELAEKFGVVKEKISIVGFQFDPTDLKDVQISDEGYFALTGGSSVQKGWGNLSAILDKLESNLTVKVSFLTNEHAESALHKFNLKKYVDGGRLELVIGLIDRAEYLKFIAASRAVLLPSYYNTTGEFVMLESMFLGKPIHAFNVGVHQDMLVDRENAMVSDIGEFDDFARKMDEVQRDEIIRRGLQLASSKMGEVLFSGVKIELLRKVFG